LTVVLSNLKKKVLKAISVEKQHLRHYLLFAFQLKKSAAEAQERICSALGKDAVSYSICKKQHPDSNGLRGIFDLNDEKHPG